ncbi:MAG: cyclic nucleotide-binding domain-containing protein [Nevskiales bacterium]
MPDFAGMEDRDLEYLAACGEIDRMQRGSVVFRQGARPEALYVLLDGHVALTGAAPDETSTVIDIVRPASSFVLANVLAEDPYLMGAEAVSATSLLRIAADPLRDLVSERPAAAKAMLRAVSRELGAMTQQVVELKRHVAAERLGSYLLSMVGDPGADKANFRLPFSKGLLASWLGCRAENLSRAFTALRACGVETHGSRVMLHDISRLKAYAGVSDAAKPVETIFSDAFRLWPKRPPGG